MKSSLDLSDLPGTDLLDLWKDVFQLRVIEEPLLSQLGGLIAAAGVRATKRRRVLSKAACPLSVACSSSLVFGGSEVKKAEQCPLSAATPIPLRARCPHRSGQALATAGDPESLGMIEGLERDRWVEKVMAVKEFYGMHHATLQAVTGPLSCASESCWWSAGWHFEVQGQGVDEGPGQPPSRRARMARLRSSTVSRTGQVNHARLRCLVLS